MSSKAQNEPSQSEIAVFGGGCFWCTEAIFQRLRGVSAVESGYAGGDMADPHAEVIKISFDPATISYEQLLDVFFHTHNPTTLNAQGNDTGPQYRSIILTTSDAQAVTARKIITKLKHSGGWERPIVTEIKPLEEFVGAERYHHNFYNENQNSPYCQLVIDPKLTHFRERYAKLISAKIPPLAPQPSSSSKS